ncbi:MAG: DUF2845 domain-containing protein [Gammaproteobacteria bacterium]
MKPWLTGLMGIAAWTAAPAFADTLRCGSSLVSTGMQMSYVLDKCGTPDDKQTISEPILGRNAIGGTYQAGTATREIWTYKRGQGKFPAVLTFEGGELKKLEFIR